MDGIAMVSQLGLSVAAVADAAAEGLYTGSTEEKIWRLLYCNKTDTLSFGPQVNLHSTHCQLVLEAVTIMFLWLVLRHGC